MTEPLHGPETPGDGREALDGPEANREAVERFLVAVRRWDRRPGDRIAAERMEQACRIMADHCGLTVRSFRDIYSALRRSGFTERQSAAAIDLVCRDRWELQA